jgi:hypothetical protein
MVTSPDGPVSQPAFQFAAVTAIQFGTWQHIRPVRIGALQVRVISMPIWIIFAARNYGPKITTIRPALPSVCVLDVPAVAPEPPAPALLA